MAYPIGLQSILQISMRGTCDGQEFISLFYYLLWAGNVPDGAQTAEDAATAFMAGGAAGNAYLPCIGNDVVDIQCEAQWIAPSRYVKVREPGGPYAGQAASATRSANIAAALTKRGDQASRHSIGTLHMPAVPDDFITNGLVSAGGQADYLNLALNLDDILVPGVGIELRPVIYNRADYTNSVRITNATVQQTIRTARRRTVGRGS